MPLPNRVLEKLEDGRVVYRPSLWAVPVLLSQSEFEGVERSFNRRVFVGISLGLMAIAPLALHQNHAISLSTAITAVLCVVGLAFLVERFLGAAAKATLKNAPIAPNYPEQAAVSKFEKLRLLSGMMAQFLDDKAIRLGLFSSTAILLSAVYGLARAIFGAPLARDINPFALVAMAILSWIWLRFLLRERRRRKARS